VLRVAGIIAEGDGYAKRQIDRIREDENVKAVVVRVDSPGGTVTGSDYLYHHLTRLRKEKGVPLVVSMGSIAASGGYYVSMAVGDQEKSIFAEPSGATGSIGVIIPHYSLTGLMKRYEIENTSIASHPNKQMLSMTKGTDSRAARDPAAVRQRNLRAVQGRGEIRPAALPQKPGEAGGAGHRRIVLVDAGQEGGAGG
jgi:signal peptide peptidase SppA